MSEEKTFKHYEQFPPEIRMEVINEMQPIDRVIFTQCSKLSQKEAKKSKNYIYELQLRLSYYPEGISVGVFHKEYDDDVPEGYEMVFKEEIWQKYIIYQLRYGRELYRVELNESVDLVEYAKEHFKNLLQQYQNTIKHLLIFETDNFDYGIRNLKRLESLFLYHNSDVLPFFSILSRPLKWLYFQNTENHEVITSGDQIYQVQGGLEANCLKINYEQFKRLNAREVRVTIWDLTAHDLYDFIKSWKSGTIRNTFRECWLNLNADFDQNELFRLLGLENNGTNQQRFEIKHDTVDRRNAKLYWCNSGPQYLTFTVPTTQNNQES